MLALYFGECCFWCLLSHEFLPAQTSFVLYHKILTMCKRVEFFDTSCKSRVRFEDQFQKKQSNLKGVTDRGQPQDCSRCLPYLTCIEILNLMMPMMANMHTWNSESILWWIDSTWSLSTECRRLRIRGILHVFRIPNALNNPLTTGTSVQGKCSHGCFARSVNSPTRSNHAGDKWGHKEQHSTSNVHRFPITEVGDSRTLYD